MSHQREDRQKQKHATKCGSVVHDVVKIWLFYSWLTFEGWGKKVLCSTSRCFLEIIWGLWSKLKGKENVPERKSPLGRQMNSLCQGVGTRWIQTKQAQTIQELQVAQVTSELRVHVTGAAAGGELPRKASTDPVTKGLFTKFIMEQLWELFNYYLI